MRLTEISKSPRNSTDYTHCTETFRYTKCNFTDFRPFKCIWSKTFIHKARYNDYCGKHKQSLKQVCPTNRFKSAKECICRYNDNAQNKCRYISDTEYIVKQISTCRKHWRCINRKEYQNKQRREYTKYVWFWMKSVLQKVGNCDWIACNLCIFSKRFCND